jgi:hypothetical protein
MKTQTIVQKPEIVPKQKPGIYHDGYIQIANGRELKYDRRALAAAFISETVVSAADRIEDNIYILGAKAWTNNKRVVDFVYNNFPKRFIDDGSVYKDRKLSFDWKPLDIAIREKYPWIVEIVGIPSRGDLRGLRIRTNLPVSEHKQRIEDFKEKMHLANPHLRFWRTACREHTIRDCVEENQQ